MATLEEEISALKARIEGYEQEYASAATTEARKDSLLAAITAKEARLTALLQQQARQEAPGKLIIPSRLHFNITAGCDFIPSRGSPITSSFLPVQAKNWKTDCHVFIKQSLPRQALFRVKLIMLLVTEMFTISLHCFCLLIAC